MGKHIEIAESDTHVLGNLFQIASGVFFQWEDVRVALHPKKHLFQRTDLVNNLVEHAVGNEVKEAAEGGEKKPAPRKPRKAAPKKEEKPEAKAEEAAAPAEEK